MSDTAPKSTPAPSKDGFARSGRYRRSKYDARALTGLSEHQVRELLGPPDSEEEGRFWFAGGRHFTRAGSDGDLVETTVDGPVPNLAPGTRYTTWFYDLMVDWAVPEADLTEPSTPMMYRLDPSWTWFLYLRDASGTGPRVVFEAASYPTDAEF